MSAIKSHHVHCEKRNFPLGISNAVSSRSLGMMGLCTYKPSLTPIYLCVCLFVSLFHPCHPSLFLFLTLSSLSLSFFFLSLSHSLIPFIHPSFFLSFFLSLSFLSFSLLYLSSLSFSLTQTLMKSCKTVKIKRVFSVSAQMFLRCRWHQAKVRPNQVWRYNDEIKSIRVMLCLGFVCRTKKMFFGP